MGIKVLKSNKKNVIHNVIQIVLQIREDKMIDLFNKGILVLVTWILKMIDFIFALFKVVAGVENVKMENDGKATSLLTGIMTQNKVLKIFIYILLLAIFLGMMFSVISAIRNFVKYKKSNAKVAGQYIYSIFGIFVVFIALYGVIILSGQILEAINMAFSEGSSLSTGNRIIKALGESAVSDQAKFDALFKEDANGISGIYKSNFVDEFYGTLNKKGMITWQFEGVAAVDPKQFQIFIALVAACIIGVCSVMALVQLVIRVYDIIFLMLVMPLPLAAYPLDDGARFGEWRKTIISKVFLAYGTIIAVNVYLLIIEVINNISFSGNLSLQTKGTSTAFLLNLFKVFMIVAGGFTISAGQLLFSRIMGTSNEESAQSGHNFRSALAGAGTAAGIAKGAGKVMFGKGKDKNQDLADKIAGSIGGGNGMSKSPTAGGGRFKGIGNAKLGEAFKKGGITGALGNIATRGGRKLFGEGSGARLAGNIKSRYQASGYAQGKKMLGNAIKDKGIIGGAKYVGASINHGKQVFNQNKENNAAYRKWQNSQKEMMPKGRKERQEFRKRVRSAKINQYKV